MRLAPAVPRSLLLLPMSAMGHMGLLESLGIPAHVVENESKSKATGKRPCQIHGKLSSALSALKHSVRGMTGKGTSILFICPSSDGYVPQMGLVLLNQILAPCVVCSVGKRIQMTPTFGVITTLHVKTDRSTGGHSIEKTT